MHCTGRTGVGWETFFQSHEHFEISETWITTKSKNFKYFGKLIKKKYLVYVSPNIPLQWFQSTSCWFWPFLGVVGGEILNWVKARKQQKPLRWFKFLKWHKCAMQIKGQILQILLQWPLLPWVVLSMAVGLFMWVKSCTWRSVHGIRV